MVISKSYYDSVDVLCEDNGKVVSSEVKAYKQNDYMTVELGGVQLNMRWQPKQKEFRASFSGLDFVANQPRTF